MLGFTKLTELHNKWIRDMIAGKDEKEGYAEIKDSVKVLRDRAGKYIKEVRDDYFAYGTSAQCLCERPTTT